MRFAEPSLRELSLRNIEQIMQEAIIFILFAGAVFFMGRMLYRQYKAEDGCGEGCHGCDVSQVSKKTSGSPH